ncbi:hypothetical protein BHE74_00032069 [Ensete ventricosum]|nr:hypothetical protein BHE74_00032069 [Ensete ventricosum]
MGARDSSSTSWYVVGTHAGGGPATVVRAGEGASPLPSSLALHGHLRASSSQSGQLLSAEATAHVVFSLNVKLGQRHSPLAAVSARCHPEWVAVKADSSVRIMSSHTSLHALNPSPPTALLPWFCSELKSFYVVNLFPSFCLACLSYSMALLFVPFLLLLMLHWSNAQPSPGYYPSYRFRPLRGFYRGFNNLWGPEHQTVSGDQSSVTIWLDRNSGQLTLFFDA